MEAFKLIINENVITSGIITVSVWTLAPDGNRYLYFYSKKWEILSDKMIPVPGFKSSEHWQLAALNEDNEIMGLFPGCQIKAWVFCDHKPPITESFIYEFK